MERVQRLGVFHCSPAGCIGGDVRECHAATSQLDAISTQRHPSGAKTVNRNLWKKLRGWPEMQSSGSRSICRSIPSAAAKSEKM